MTKNKTAIQNKKRDVHVGTAESLEYLSTLQADRSGSQLLTEAQNQVKQKNGEVVMRQLRELINHRDNLKVAVRKATDELNRYEFIIDLVNDGKFHVDMEGHLIIDYPDDPNYVPRHMRPSAYDSTKG